jgi:hypothetical protein
MSHSDWFLDNSEKLEKDASWKAQKDSLFMKHYLLPMAAGALLGYFGNEILIQPYISDYNWLVKVGPRLFFPLVGAGIGLDVAENSRERALGRFRERIEKEEAKEKLPR